MPSALLPVDPGHTPLRHHYATDPRAADWRFLLPGLPRGSVLCVGGALSPVPLVLARTAREVVVIAPPEDLTVLHGQAQTAGQPNIRGVPAGPSGDLLPAERFDLVAALRPAPGDPRSAWHARDLPALVRRVARGGRLYLEIARPGLFQSPERWRRRLARLGFRQFCAYWPKPDFEHCELLLPLGDRPIQQYYLDQMFFAMSTARRFLRVALRMAVFLGLFERLLPGYAIIAGRGAAGRGGDVGAN